MVLSTSGRMVKKRTFDVDDAMHRLRDAVAPYPKAALFELAADGHSSSFEMLVACIISIRTRDETTIPAARSLCARATTAAKMAQLSEQEIDQLIAACTFHEPKSKTIRDIAVRVVEEFDGDLPCDLETLLSFHGVGPKCANLALGVARNVSRISVDVHVWRVTNRWGYVETKTPEKTMRALQEKLPHAYWIEINALLVPFGKHVCTGVRPKCSTCPLLSTCRQVGVTSHR